MLSYIDDLLMTAPRADAEWFYAKLLNCFTCKGVQWLSKDKPLDHLGMTIFMTDVGVCITVACKITFAPCS